MLVSVGLFWAINSYSLGVGTMRGEQVERELPGSPDVVIYTDKSLDLQLPGVRETVCSPSQAAADAAYRFRYDGLRLVLQSGGQYLFLPATWAREDGIAVVTPRSNAFRLDFGPPGRALSPEC